MRSARDHACRFTSISSKYACPGNDGGEHDAVCDLMTKATEARDDEHAGALARLDPRTVHQAMQDAPHDGKDFRQARAAIKACVELTR